MFKIPLISNNFFLFLNKTMTKDIGECCFDKNCQSNQSKPLFGLFTNWFRFRLGISKSKYIFGLNYV